MHLAVGMQADATIRRWIVIDRKLVAALHELPAGRRRADNLYAVVILVVGLMNMTEYSQPDLACRLKVGEKFFTIVEAYRVEPRATHRNRRMMQAHHDMLGLAGSDDGTESRLLIVGDAATGTAGGAAVDADDQPVAGFRRSTIMKRRLGERLAHQGPNVVIARHTIDRQLQLREQLATLFVGPLRVVLNQVTGERSDIRAPAASLIVPDDARKRCMGHYAAKNAGCVAE